MRHALLALAFVYTPAALLGQGPLTPPGAPAPTMKSLDQIHSEVVAAKDAAEAASSAAATPRLGKIEINATNTPGDENNLFIITEPGSYYLPSSISTTENKDVIEVRADFVTIDLNGHTIQCELDAIAQSAAARTHITIRNGKIRTNAGSGAYLTNSDFVVLEDVVTFAFEGGGVVARNNATVRDCVFNGQPVSVGNYSRVVNTVVHLSSNHGIMVGQRSVVKDCSVSSTNDEGIVLGQGSSATGCTVGAIGSSGISAGADAVIKDCRISECAVSGIVSSASRLLVENNRITNVKEDGIVVGAASRVVGNFVTEFGLDAQNTTGAGIRLNGGGSYVDGNHVNGGDIGYHAASGDHLLVRNYSAFVTTDYQVSANTNNAAIAANPASGFASTNPWTNFAD